MNGLSMQLLLGAQATRGTDKNEKYDKLGIYKNSMVR